MGATPVDAWPAGHGYVIELKFDGWRCLVFCLPSGVFLQSRTGRDLSRYFPEIVAVARQLPLGTIIDSELVIWHNDRTDFSLLQRRIAVRRSPEYPANLVCFDLLEHPTDGVQLAQPLNRRRHLLEQILDGAPPELAISPQSTSWQQADEWLTHRTAAGVEGVL